MRLAYACAIWGKSVRKRARRVLARRGSFGWWATHTWSRAAAVMACWVESSGGADTAGVAGRKPAATGKVSIDGAQGLPHYRRSHGVVLLAIGLRPATSGVRLNAAQITVAGSGRAGLEIVVLWATPMSTMSSWPLSCPRSRLASRSPEHRKRCMSSSWHRRIYPSGPWPSRDP